MTPSPETNPRVSFLTSANSWAQKNHKILVILFFVLFMVLGISIVRSFGVSYDEDANRENGYVSFGYVIEQINPALYNKYFSGLPPLQQYRDRDYGVFFDLPAVILEYDLGIQDQSHIVYMRHFLTFLIFFIAIIAYYRMIQQRFNNWKIGLLGCAMLIISPRIFGQAFYNSKDIVFMSFFLIGTYTLIRFLKQPDWQKGVTHALACTAAIDTRVMGILLPLLTIVIIAREVVNAPDIKQALIKWGKLLIVYFMVLIGLVIICWPYLWSSPFSNFVTALQNMSKFRWEQNSLFMGHYITPSKYIPWYYIPVWIIITTPVLYTILFITGVIVVVKNIARAGPKLYSNEEGRSDLIFLLAFFVPLVAVIVLGSVLYDGWRQVYFIYPAFILLGLTGFVALYNSGLKKTVFKYGLIAVTALTFINTTAFMVRNHPLEDVYFSCLPDKVAEKNFELDYWALSYQSGLHYILQHDTSKVILLGYSTFARASLNILPDADRKRIKILALSDTLTPKAKWMITNFRFDKLPPGKPQKEVYSVYVDKMKVMSVFKLN